MGQLFLTCRCAPKGLLCFGMTVPATSGSEQTSVGAGISSSEHVSILWKIQANLVMSQVAMVCYQR